VKEFNSVETNAVYFPHNSVKCAPILIIFKRCYSDNYVIKQHKNCPPKNCASLTVFGADIIIFFCDRRGF